MFLCLQTLDKHTNLATVLLGQIKARALDQYNSVAEDLLCGKGDRGAVLKLLQGGKGSAGDKLRLALVWLLTYEGECGQLWAKVWAAPSVLVYYLHEGTTWKQAHKHGPNVLPLSHDDSVIGLPNDADIGEIVAALQAAGADVTPLQYVRTLKRNNLTGQQQGRVDQGALFIIWQRMRCPTR